MGYSSLKPLPPIAWPAPVSAEWRSARREGDSDAGQDDAPRAVPVHGPTYHSLAMWRHPRTAEAGYDWTRPELYQHIARVCERGKFDMVFFADLNYISDTYRGTMDPAIRHATQVPEHDPIPLLSFMARGDVAHRARRDLLHQSPAPVLRGAALGHARSPHARARGVERRDVAQPQPVGELRRGAPADRRALRPRARVHRGLPEAVGELGARRRRDGSRGRRLRRPREGASHRARGPLLQVARPAQRRALAAERPRDPAGRDVAEGRAFAARYADAIFAIQPNIAGARPTTRTSSARPSDEGRAPEACKILFGIQPILGADRGRGAGEAGAPQRARAAGGRPRDPLGAPRLRPVEAAARHADGAPHRAAAPADADAVPHADRRAAHAARGGAAPRPERRAAADGRHAGARWPTRWRTTSTRSAATASCCRRSTLRAPSRSSSTSSSRSCSGAAATGATTRGTTQRDHLMQERLTALRLLSRAANASAQPPGPLAETTTLERR